MASLLRPALLSLLLLSAACAPSQPPKINVPEDRGDFASNLAGEYFSFSISESEQGRGAASEHFTRKGLEAQTEGDAEPEKTRDWNMEATDERDDLQGARRRLLRLKSEFLQRVASQDLARAQVVFDCWVYHTNTGVTDVAETCRSSFLTEIRALEAIEKTREERHELKLPSSYTILFRSGSARLDRDAHYAIGQAIALTKKFPEYQIDVAGHSDSEGEEAENQHLSERRAKNVTQALIAAGVQEEYIDTAWLGQDDPHEPVLIGTASRENRRVEVEVSKRRGAPAKKAPETVTDTDVTPTE